MGHRISYARVSTEDQDLSIQKTALDRDGCAIVFEEKKSGTQRAGRAQLDLALKVSSRAAKLSVTTIRQCALLAVLQRNPFSVRSASVVTTPGSLRKMAVRP